MLKLCKALINLGNMTCFENIVGNNQIKTRLARLLENKRLAHLLLFSGIEGIGKRLFANALARSYLESARDAVLPDLHLLQPEGKSGLHQTARVREMLDAIQLAPYSSKNKALIIDDAERMLPAASNALLKTLEEPPKNTLIILVSSAPQSILPTILSRSHTFRFLPCTEQEIANFLVQTHGIEQKAAESLAAGARGSISKALQASSDLEARLVNFLARSIDKPTEIVEISRFLQNELEQWKKGQEASLKESYSVNLKEQTASFRQMVEQEIEGILSVMRLKRVYKLLFTVQAFYRDLLMLSSGKQFGLYLQEHREDLVQAVNRGRHLSLDKIEKWLTFAKQSIERQTPIQNVFECLFLQINQEICS